MKTIIVSGAVALVGASALLAAPPWEDPSVNEINRLPARAISGARCLTLCANLSDMCPSKV